MKYAEKVEFLPSALWAADHHIVDIISCLCYFYFVSERWYGMIRESIRQTFRETTPEEEEILQSLKDTGSGPPQPPLADSHKLISEGKLIALRPHPRFVPSYEHRHNYIEMVYVCSGRVTHIVNGKSITMEPGELLFLDRNALHEVLTTTREDIALNFVIQPEFFGTPLSLIGEEATALRSFLIDCLFNQNAGPGYLYFKVSEDMPIQNLVENLILTLRYPKANRRKISQITMTLLFLEILGRTEAMEWDESESRTLKALEYIENHYIDGGLAQAAELLRCNISTLSRDIRRKTGKTYTQLIQEKRLSQASFLLHTTDWTVERIALAVGYENVSYFHRLFQQHFGQSPRQHRLGKMDAPERSRT